MFNQDYEKRLLHSEGEVKDKTLSKMYCGEFGSPSSLSSSSSPLLKGRQMMNCSGGDRFIPSRAYNNLQSKYAMIHNENESSSSSSCRKHDGIRGGGGGDDHHVYCNLLKNEMMDVDVSNGRAACDDERVVTKRLFQYLPRRTSGGGRGGGGAGGSEGDRSVYSLSPLHEKSQLALQCGRRRSRNISKLPFKILDAPQLQDDFYLNLIDWSSKNILSVGLGHCVYLWSPSTGQVSKLCDLSREDDDDEGHRQHRHRRHRRRPLHGGVGDDDDDDGRRHIGNTVTSVSWNEDGNVLAVGTYKCSVRMWDVRTCKEVQRLQGHSARVGCLAWNGNHTLTSGGRDGRILHTDTRCPPRTTWQTLLSAHRQEVCGLRWSPDKQLLASGGNDNRLYIWNASWCSTPVQTYTQHVAAIKAIAWSPHHHGVVVSGGGTADRTIRVWNTLTGQLVSSVDTGSQVCNIAWAKHSCELVSTHGYSENHIVLWKYPAMRQVVKLTGHACRVLYLAVSPHGEDIVTGAADETLRFWNVFSSNKTGQAHAHTRSQLSLHTRIR